MGLGNLFGQESFRIVELRGQEVGHFTIFSTVERHTRSTGGTQRGGNPRLSATGSSERRQGERRAHEITAFYNQVIKAVAGAAAIVVLAGWWTWRRRDRDATIIAAGWAVWAIVAPRIAWTWYATWTLPFLLLAIPTWRSRWQRVLVVIMLALMNLQLQDWASAILGIALLIYFLWIS
jgi:hypothetical protein